MTPDSIILLSDDARLDALIDLMHQAKAKALATLNPSDWEAWELATERLHDELMAQVDKPIKVLEEAADTNL